MTVHGLRRPVTTDGLHRQLDSFDTLGRAGRTGAVERDGCPEAPQPRTCPKWKEELFRSGDFIWHFSSHASIPHNNRINQRFCFTVILYYDSLKSHDFY